MQRKDDAEYVTFKLQVDVAVAICNVRLFPKSRSCFRVY